MNGKAILEYLKGKKVLNLTKEHKIHIEQYQIYFANLLKHKTLEVYTKVEYAHMDSYVLTQVHTHKHRFKYSSSYAAALN